MTSSGVRVVGRTIMTGLFTRGPGCGSFCSSTRGHDAASHEYYGRDQVYGEVAARPTGVVRTGPLAVDFDEGRVLVADQEAPVTPTEEEILRYLATRVGRRCRHFEIVAAVWGAAWADSEQTRGHGRWHLLRVHLTRLRLHLGPAGPLVETVPHFGYRLRAVPPVTVEA